VIESRILGAGEARLEFVALCFTRSYGVVLAIETGTSVQAHICGVIKLRRPDVRDEALVAEDGRRSKEGASMVLRHHVVRHQQHEQYPLHDWLATEQQKIRGCRCQPERDHRGDINSRYSGFGAKLGTLARRHLGYETLAMEMDSRLKGKDKHQQAHADDEAAFQKFAICQDAHTPTVIQKQ
jgi:hypothetical protein